MLAAGSVRHFRPTFAALAFQQALEVTPDVDARTQPPNAATLDSDASSDGHYPIGETPILAEDDPINDITDATRLSSAFDVTAWLLDRQAYDWPTEESSTKKDGTSARSGGGGTGVKFDANPDLKWLTKGSSIVHELTLTPVASSPHPPTPSGTAPAGVKSGPQEPIRLQFPIGNGTMPGLSIGGVRPISIQVGGRPTFHPPPNNNNISSVVMQPPVPSSAVRPEDLVPPQSMVMPLNIDNTAGRLALGGGPGAGPFPSSNNPPPLFQGRGYKGNQGSRIGQYTSPPLYAPTDLSDAPNLTEMEPTSHFKGPSGPPTHMRPYPQGSFQPTSDLHAQGAAPPGRYGGNKQQPWHDQQQHPAASQMPFNGSSANNAGSNATAPFSAASHPPRGGLAAPPNSSPSWYEGSAMPAAGEQRQNSGAAPTTTVGNLQGSRRGPSGPQQPQQPVVGVVVGVSETTRPHPGAQPAGPPIYAGAGYAPSPTGELGSIQDRSLMYAVGSNPRLTTRESDGLLGSSNPGSVRAPPPSIHHQSQPSAPMPGLGRFHHSPPPQGAFAQPDALIFSGTEIHRRHMQQATSGQMSSSNTATPYLGPSHLPPAQLQPTQPPQQPSSRPHATQEPMPPSGRLSATQPSADTSFNRSPSTPSAPLQQPSAVNAVASGAPRAPTTRQNDPYRVEGVTSPGPAQGTTRWRHDPYLVASPPPPPTPTNTINGAGSNTSPHGPTNNSFDSATAATMMFPPPMTIGSSSANGGTNHNGSNGYATTAALASVANEQQQREAQQREAQQREAQQRDAQQQLYGTQPRPVNDYTTRRPSTSQPPTNDSGNYFDGSMRVSPHSIQSQDRSGGGSAMVRGPEGGQGAQRGQQQTALPPSHPQMPNHHQPAHHGGQPEQPVGSQNGDFFPPRDVRLPQHLQQQPPSSFDHPSVHLPTQQQTHPVVGQRSTHAQPVQPSAAPQGFAQAPPSGAHVHHPNTNGSQGYARPGSHYDPDSREAGTIPTPERNNNGGRIPQPQQPVHLGQQRAVGMAPLDATGSNAYEAAPSYGAVANGPPQRYAPASSYRGQETTYAGGGGYRDGRSHGGDDIASGFAAQHRASQASATGGGGQRLSAQSSPSPSAYEGATGYDGDGAGYFPPSQQPPQQYAPQQQQHQPYQQPQQHHQYYPAPTQQQPSQHPLQQGDYPQRGATVPGNSGYPQQQQQSSSHHHHHHHGPQGEAPPTFAPNNFGSGGGASHLNPQAVTHNNEGVRPHITTAPPQQQGQHPSQSHRHVQPMQPSVLIGGSSSQATLAMSGGYPPSPVRDAFPQLSGSGSGDLQQQPLSNSGQQPETTTTVRIGGSRPRSNSTEIRVGGAPVVPGGGPGHSPAYTHANYGTVAVGSTAPATQGGGGSYAQPHEHARMGAAGSAHHTPTPYPANAANAQPQQSFQQLGAAPPQQYGPSQQPPHRHQPQQPSLPQVGQQQQHYPSSSQQQQQQQQYQQQPHSSPVHPQSHPSQRSHQSAQPPLVPPTAMPQQTQHQQAGHIPSDPYYPGAGPAQQTPSQFGADGGYRGGNATTTHGGGATVQYGGGGGGYNSNNNAPYAGGPRPGAGGTLQQPPHHGHVGGDRDYVAAGNGGPLQPQYDPLIVHSNHRPPRQGNNSNNNNVDRSAARLSQRGGMGPVSGMHHQQQQGGGQYGPGQELSAPIDRPFAPTAATTTATTASPLLARRVSYDNNGTSLPHISVGGAPMPMPLPSPTIASSGPPPAALHTAGGFGPAPQVSAVVPRVGGASPREPIPYSFDGAAYGGEMASGGGSHEPSPSGTNEGDSTHSPPSSPSSPGRSSMSRGRGRM